MNTEFTFFEIRKNNGDVTKGVYLNAVGELCKNTDDCFISVGTGYNRTMSLPIFAEYLGNASSNVAMTHGLPNSEPVSDHKKYTIVSQKIHQTVSWAITRTRENFEYPKKTPALTMFDFDPSPGQPYISPPDMVEIVSEIMPVFKGAAKVVNYSVSSFIYKGEELVSGENAGYHLYFLVKDGSDIPRFSDVLFKRLILQGYGYIQISKSGALLLRTIIDKSVFSPERLDFIAAADCQDPLIQKRPAPEYIDGDILDTSLLLDLSNE